MGGSALSPVLSAGTGTTWWLLHHRVPWRGRLEGWAQWDTALLFAVSVYSPRSPSGRAGRFPIWWLRTPHIIRAERPGLPDSEAWNPQSLHPTVFYRLNRVTMGQPGLEHGEQRLMGHLWRAASSSPCPITMPVVELIPACPHLIFAEIFSRVSTVHVIDKLVRVQLPRGS